MAGTKISQLTNGTGLDPTDTLVVVRAGSNYRVPAQFRSGLWFDVKAQNAAGDGATNDTTALQAANTAASAIGGSVIQVPPGVYMTDPLTISGNIIWQGCGVNSILKMRPPAGQVALLNMTAQSEIVFRDLVIDGNESSTSQNVFGASIITSGGKIIFDHCIFQNLSGPGIQTLSPVADVSIVDCEFINCGTKHALGTAVNSSSPRLLVKGCLFQDWGGTNYGRGIITAGSDSQILGNRFRSPAGKRTAQAVIVASGGDRTVVANNTVDHTGYVGTGRTNCGIWIDTAVNVTIEGNVIRCPLQDDGGIEPIGLLPGADDAIISGNFCSGGDDNGISLWGNRAVCIGNHVEACAFDGISVNGSDCVVVGNKINSFGLRTSVSPSAPGPFAGISVFTGQNRAAINGNHIAQSAASVPGIYGIETRGTSDSNEIWGNVINPTNLTGRIKRVGVFDQHQDDPLGIRVVATSATPDFVQAATVVTANRLHANRFVSGGPITAIELLVGGVTSGNFIISIYDGDGTAGAPSTRLWTSGSTAFGAINTVQSVAIGTTFFVDPARHWLAFIADNATVTIMQFSSTDSLWAHMKSSCFRDPGSFISPAPFGTASGALIRNIALIGV